MQIVKILHVTLINKYPSINDITREVHGLVQGEVNISGPEQRMPKDFSQALKSESLHLSCDYWQMAGIEMSRLMPCEVFFWIDEVFNRFNIFDGQMPRQVVLDLN